MGGITEKISGLFKTGNNSFCRLLLILLAGVCLVVIVWPSGAEDDEEGPAETVKNEGLDEGTAECAQAEAYGSAEYFTDSMEQKLKEVLSGMKGVSDVSVMITVKDDGERIALKDTSKADSSSDGSSTSTVTEETVKSDGEGSSYPYVTQNVQPRVEGVVVCCKGAEAADTAIQITNAVQALFDVPVHKIVVLESN